MLRSTAVALFLEGLPFLDYLSLIQVSFPPKLFSHSCGYSLVSLRIGRAYKCHFVHPTFYAQTHILPGKGNGTPLQYSCLENPKDGGAWWATVHGVAKSQTRLSDFAFPFHSHALEKEMATHSSVIAWRIPGMVEPGGLLSTGSHRVGHDWSDLAGAAAHSALWHLFSGDLDLFFFLI